MKQYLLILKGKKELDYSPQELQKRLEEYRKWVSTLSDKYVQDNRLERSGAHIKSEDNVVMDGPFLESKEIIGGFIIIKSTNLSDAVALAKTSPLLQYFEIYVRPIV
ncbi:MAG: YciI family protein [Bacteroidota bacterium]